MMAAQQAPAKKTPAKKAPARKPPRKPTPAEAKAARIKRRQLAKQQQDVFSTIESKFGITDAILDADPTDPRHGFTLREAFDQIRREQITDPNRAAQIINKTNWFRAHGAGILERIALRQSNPGVYRQNVADRVNQLRRSFTAAGIAVDESRIAAMGTDAYEYGLTDIQVVDKYRGSLQAASGSDPETQLRDFAQSMGVMMTDSWYKDAAKQVVTQAANMNTYQEELRQQAKTTYSYWADRIDQGQTVASLANQYLAYAQQWLEDPTISLNDQTVRKALQPGDGSNQPAPLWAFEKTVKSDPRWLRTQNAQRTIANTAGKLLQDWGRA